MDTAILSAASVLAGSSIGRSPPSRHPGSRTVPVPRQARLGQRRAARAANDGDRAEEIIQRVVDTYHQPNRDFRSQYAVKAGEYDILRPFTAACRDELSR